MDLFKIFEGLEFSVEYNSKSFEALVLKQKQKIDKGDLEDIKDADIKLIKDMYSKFPDKTEATDEAYELILVNFPE